MKITGNISNSYLIKNEETKSIRNTDSSLSITTEEKEYFNKLFPDHRAEIEEYQVYRKKGIQKNIFCGSIIDRRI